MKIEHKQVENSLRLEIDQKNEYKIELKSMKN